jgi:cobalamin biosynthesis Mg chelatase CobN
MPQGGTIVSFGTDDPTVASVSPGSAVTNASGEAEVKVRGEARGQTSVNATANGASDSKPVKVPDLSLYGMVLLVVAVVIVVIMRRQKALR